MRAQELRIGNYIQDKHGSVDQVYELLVIKDLKEKINDDPYEGYFQPIPLTEQWLVRAGFMHAEDGIYFLDLNKSEDSDESRECSIKAALVDGSIVANLVDENGWDISRQFSFVHELQNMVFALTGEELTIKTTPV